MKRMFSGLQRRVSTFPSSSQDNSNNASPASSGNESPEETVIREIKAFCEADGGPNRVANDYLHLPAIVEAAESSATAAKEAAARIRKYLSTPSKPQGSAQYNAVMLIRILSENPGHTFTRNIDAKFVSTVRDLLREGRDMSAQHMLRETLDQFEAQNSWDEDLAGLLAMWKKEKARAAKHGGGQGQSRSSPGHRHHQQPPYNRHSTRPRQLPPPDELAARVSEARTSANLLIQLCQSTPAAEVKDNELMKEFSERCSGAARSIQEYMAVESPPPDEDTMLTLIETNEHLSVAVSKYQRAVLNGRRAVGATTNNSNGGANINNNVNLNGNDNGTATRNVGTNESAPFRPVAPAEPPRQASSPPFLEEIPSLAPLSSTEEPHFSHSAFPEPSPAKPSTPPPAAQPAQRRFEYDADEFQVENPFADSAADNDHHSISPDHARHV